MQEDRPIAQVAAHHEVIDPNQDYRTLSVNDAPFVVRVKRAAGEAAAERELAHAVGKPAGDRVAADVLADATNTSGMSVRKRARASSIPITRRIAQFDGGSGWSSKSRRLSQSRNPADRSE